MLWEDATAPAGLLRREELRPASNLLAVFDGMHNYVYANEGLLKEKIFHEIVELLLLKLADEQGKADESVRFGITPDEIDEVEREGTSTSFEARLADLLGEVRNRYPELFPDNRRVGLRPATLAHVVAALQPYSLTKTPGDVKGQAFQSFVYANQRGDRGEYFTPDPVVRVAVGMVDPRPGESVVDPACGSGGFLVETLRYVAHRNSLKEQDREAYVQDCLRGMEFNPDVARSAGIRLTFEGGGGHEVQCVDSLKTALDHEGNFDVVVTNPPFGSKGKVTNPQVLAPYDLGYKWRDVEKTETLSPQSPEVLFLELSLRLLKPGGRLAIVLPDGFLQNASTRYIRAWLERHALIRGVVSVTQTAFVPYGTGIKTSVLVAEKSDVSQRVSVFMAQLTRIGYDSKGQPTYVRDNRGRPMVDTAGAPCLDDESDAVAETFRSWTAGKSVDSETEARFVVPAPALNSRFDVEHYLPSDLELLQQLAAAGARPLGELVDFVTKGDNFRRKDEEIRYVALSDVDPKTLQIVSAESLPPAEAPSRATYRLHEGDIITATSGASTGTSRHATALVTEEDAGAIASNGFAVLRNIREINPLYLLAFMRTQVFLRQVRRLLTGHAIPAVSVDDLRRVLVPIPAPDEQQQVALKLADLLELRREAHRQSQEIVDATSRVVSGLLTAP